MRQELTRRWAQTKFPPVSTVTGNNLNFPDPEACDVGAVLLSLPVFSIAGLATSSKAFALSSLMTKPLLQALSLLPPQQKTPIF